MSRGSGGAMEVLQASANVHNSRFLNNIGILAVGAIDVSSRISIVAPSFNRAPAAPPTGAASLSVDSSTFQGNAGGCVGAIGTDNGAAITISNSAFTSNRSTHGPVSPSLDCSSIVFVAGQGSISNSRFVTNITKGSYGTVVVAPLSTGSASPPGSMTVLNTTFTENSTAGTGGAIFGFANTNLSVMGSTFNHNTAQGSSGGGAVAVNGFGSIVNSTFFGNNATTGPGGGVTNSGSLLLSDDTLAANRTGAIKGGNIYAAAGILRVRETLVASGTPNNCGASALFNSLGANLSSDASCKPYFNKPTDKNSVNPLLGPLASNGGPTQTMALLAGSPAINAVPLALCLFKTDQRGVARPQGIRCDIGAYEK